MNEFYDAKPLETCTCHGTEYQLHAPIHLDEDGGLGRYEIQQHVSGAVREHFIVDVIMAHTNREAKDKFKAWEKDTLEAELMRMEAFQVD